jgi:hypothetical protein
LRIQSFAVLEGTRGYPPPEKRFSRKSLSVSTVCSRTPRQPLLIGQQQRERQGRKAAQLRVALRREGAVKRGGVQFRLVPVFQHRVQILSCKNRVSPKTLSTLPPSRCQNFGCACRRCRAAAPTPTFDPLTRNTRDSPARRRSAAPTRRHGKICGRRSLPTPPPGSVTLSPRTAGH